MKRTISIALFLAILTSFASCETQSEKVEDTTETNPTDTTITPVDDIYTDLPTADHGGMEINILGYGANSEKEYLDAEQTGDVVDDALFQRNIETEERLGVDIIFSIKGGATTANDLFRSSVMAGDNDYDLLTTKSFSLGNILSSGILRSWNDIDGINYDKPWYIHDANETMTVGNQTYALFSDACGTNITMCWSYFFNKRIAEEWKVGDLYQIVRDGDWTFDTLTSITKDIWSDLNGNSERDSEDMYGLYVDIWATLDACMLSHGLTAISKDEDDLPFVNFYSERLVTSFEKTYSLWWENPGTFVDQSDAYNNVKFFAQGQALAIPSFIQYAIESDMRSMVDDYGILPFPKLDDKQENYCTYVHPRYGMMLLPLTLTEEKAAVIGDFAEVWSAFSYKYLRPALYDISLTAKGTRDEESIEMLELIMDSRKYDFMTGLQSDGSFPLTNDMTYRNLLGIRNKDITSFYESRKESADKYIADLVEKLQEALS